MVKAKICGLSTEESVQAALTGGAAFLGFIFLPKSPRSVAPEAAARLAAPARGRAKVVAVVVDPSDALVDEIAEEPDARPDPAARQGDRRPAPPRSPPAPAPG